MTGIITFSFIITNGLAGAIMKESFQNVLVNVPNLFVNIISLVYKELYYYARYFRYYEESFLYSFSGFIYGFSILLIIIGVFACLTLIYNSFSAMVYLIVKEEDSNETAVIDS